MDESTKTLIGIGSILGLGYMVKKQKEDEDGNGGQPSETYTVTVDTDGGGIVKVKSDGQLLGTVNQTDTFQVQGGKTLSLEPVASSGWHFENYSGTTPPVNVNSDINIIAVFRKDSDTSNGTDTSTLTLTVTGPTGSVEVEVGGSTRATVSAGSTRSLEIDNGTAVDLTAITEGFSVPTGYKLEFKGFTGETPPFLIRNNENINAEFQLKSTSDTGNGGNGGNGTPPDGQDTYEITVSVYPGGNVGIWVGDDKVDSTTGGFGPGPRTDTVTVEAGKHVVVYPFPWDGYELVQGSYQEFDIQSDRNFEFDFEETSNGGNGDGSTGHPFDIPDSVWSYINSGVQEFLKDPSANDRDNCIVFGFAGWFNDNKLVGTAGCGGHYPNYSQEYAENVADIIKKDAEMHGPDECIVDVHWAGPLKQASSISKSELISKIENW